MITPTLTALTLLAQTTDGPSLPGAPAPAASAAATDATGAAAPATFQLRGSSLAVLATNPSTSGIAPSAARSTPAAQPVTSRRAAGWALRAPREEEAF